MADTYIHPELRNLATDLEEKELSEIGSSVLSDYESDLESRTKWDQMHSQWLRMYFQKDRPKNPPWDGSSQESLPLLSESCTQFSSRAIQAMFSSRKVIKAMPLGRVDSGARSRAKRIEEHMAFQIMDKMRGYKRGKRRMLLSVALHGSHFTKAYFDPLNDMNVVENIRATDIAIPYGTGPRDIEDVPRITHRIPMPMHKAKKLYEADYFSEEPVPYEKDEIAREQDQAHDEALGLQPSSRHDKREALILEQHTWFDLDDDGVDEPYIFTVDAQNGNVLRVSIRWETDEAGDPTDDQNPVNCFTHYVYMENPDGFYGLGHGHLISQLNASVNKLLRQMVDAGTLSTVGNNSGFISEQIAGPAGGDIEFSLGKFKKVPASADEIGKGIHQFKFPGPSPVHPQAIQLLLARSDRLSSATEAITGQTEKVMQPTTVMALIEQGLQVFSSVYDTLSDAWTEELMKIYRLNHKHMDPEEWFTVFDVEGSEQELHAAREDYAPDFQVKPFTDPKQATSQQKLQKAQIAYQTAMQSPLVMNSPQHIYNNVRMFMEEMDIEDIDSRIPNPMQGIPRNDDPYQENMMAMMDTPMIPMAYPDQDHISHMRAHMEQLSGKTISPFGQMLLENHIESHRRLLNGSTGGQGLAPGPGNEMGVGASPMAVQPGAEMGAGLLTGGSEATVGTETGPGVSPGTAGAF